MFYADVILPLAIRQTFTYQINQEQANFLLPGMRVVVPFGKKKIYTSIVIRIHQNKPAYDTKNIEFILDEQPIFSQESLQLLIWVSNYYLSSLGEVLKTFLPSSFLLESETIVEKNTQEVDTSLLSDDEFLIYEALTHSSSLTTKEISQIIQKKDTIAVLNSLLEKQIIRLTEKIYEKYKPKLEKYVRFSPKYEDKYAVNELLESNILKTLQQEKLVFAFLSLQSHKNKLITPAMLLEKAEVSASVLKKLIENGIFTYYTQAIDRVSFTSDSQVHTLTPTQQIAFTQIQEKFNKKPTVLLHGVASSGKTEIYCQLIEKTLREGKQILYLLPEIAISTQLMTRLEHFFGDKMSIYHSKYSTNERVEVWNNVLYQREKAQLVIGVRTAVALPFSNLGLIIIDEEHDISYKVNGSSPRFQVRDTALMLAHLHNAKTLLGSATPSVESYYNAQVGKYGFVELTERFSDTLPPIIELIDLKEKTKKKETHGHFTDTLIEAIKNTISDNKQVILLQNRRGYSPFLECEVCNNIPQCPNCDVSLTFHQLQNHLKCHYCGHTIAKPISCLACGSHKLQLRGLGTEKVEEELIQIFPKARIERMDMDSTKGKHSYEKIIARFEQHQTDILVGTQMVSKGLDFPNVGLVGIMNADLYLHQPDYRAAERAYQLLSHIAGRAGRKDTQGKVLIQTYAPFQPTLQQVTHQNYQQMVSQQLQERKDFHYPPFVRLIRIIFKHKDYQKINEGSEWFAKSLRLGLISQGVEVLGAEFPSVARIRNEYIKHILLKIPHNLSLNTIKGYILGVEKSFLAVGVFSSINISYNVDI